MLIFRAGTGGGALVTGGDREGERATGEREGDATVSGGILMGGGVGVLGLTTCINGTTKLAGNLPTCPSMHFSPIHQPDYNGVHTCG